MPVVLSKPASWRAAWIALALPGAALAQTNRIAARYDAERPAHDAIHYDIEIVLADSGSRFKAVVATEWRLVGSAPIRINLDSSYRIDRLTIDDRPAAWRRRDADLLLVTVPAGKTRVVTRIEYEGAPPKFTRNGRPSGQDDGLVQRGSGADRKIFADNWPNRARKWLAAQDHPDDKATVSWNIVAPAGLTVVANGRLESTEPAGPGLTRWRFVNEQPIPVYTMVLGAARLAVTKLGSATCPSHCVPVSVYTYPEDSAWAVTGPFRRGVEMIEYVSRIVGPFPYDELRHVETSTIFGGMENSTVIFYDENAYRRQALNEGTVAHETAHQWFGDAATEADWHHLWLSEGFATYFAALWNGYASGDTSFARTIAGYKRSVMQDSIVERPILDPAATDLLGLLNSNNYPKGALVLHGLRGLIGDSAFFRGLRTYFATYRHKNALSSDFARVMGKEAGRDLGWYFNQALTQPGYPIVQVKTELEGGHLVVSLTQIQKPGWGTFRLPNLEIRLGGRTIVVPMEGRTARTVTHWTAGDPPVVEVDPQGWWLLEAKTAP